MLVGITGPTCSGKSLLCSELQRRFAPRKVVVIHQDDFYKESGFIKAAHYDNWDHPSAIKWQELHDSVKQAMKENELVILEGHTILSYQPLVSELRCCFFITLSEAVCKQRRMNRDPWLRENVAYFELCIWPEYVRYHRSLTRIIDEYPHLNITELNGENAVESILESIVQAVSACTSNSH